MSLFDSLKKQSNQSINSRINQTARNLGQAAKSTASGIGNKSWTVTFQQLPANLAQLQAMPEAALTEPQNTAALTVAVLCMYPVAKEACLEMLNFLQGPKGMTGYDKQFLADRFRGKDYIAASFFQGATPENGYEPTQPYTVTVYENPYSRDQIGEGYLTLYLKSAGADSIRPVKLRNKPSTGQWFLWEQMLLSDIRQPVAADPWA